MTLSVVFEILQTNKDATMCFIIMAVLWQKLYNVCSLADNRIYVFFDYYDKLLSPWSIPTTLHCHLVHRWDVPFVEFCVWNGSCYIWLNLNSSSFDSWLQRTSSQKVWGKSRCVEAEFRWTSMLFWVGGGFHLAAVTVTPCDSPKYNLWDLPCVY